MKKIASIVAAAMLMLGCSGSFSRPTVSETVDVKSLRENTVVLVNNDGEGYDMFCAGVWIREKQFLTAFHCVASYALHHMSEEQQLQISSADDLHLIGKELNYKTYDDYEREYEVLTSQRARTARVIRAETATDLALLEILGNAPTHGIVALHTGKVSDGSDVWVVGHSVGMQFSISRGIVSASRRDKDLTILQLSVAASPGNSGGPAFDTQGNLVGIISAGHRNAALMTFAVHRDSINDFLSL